MLAKLIGYEMKAFGRIILPLYAATIGMSFIMGVGIRVLDEELYTSLLGAITIMIFVTLVIATMVMTGLLCVQRFYQNLLANEGYLMFSLPVGTHQLILSKVLGSLIWAVLGGVAGICTVAVMGLAAVPMQDAIRFLTEIRTYIRMYAIGKEIGSILLWFLIAILLFAATLMQIYTALAIGHQWTAHRILGSVIAYFVIDLIKSTFSWILAGIGFYSGLGGTLGIQLENGQLAMGKLQAGILISAVVLIVIYSAVTWYLLDRKLNLE